MSNKHQVDSESMNESVSVSFFREKTQVNK